MVALAVLGGAGAARAAEEGGLAVVRTAEGAADFERAGQSGPVVADATLKNGDWLTTARNARLEVVLADGTLVHVAGDSELVLVELAGPEAAGAPNRLLLARGELLVTGADAGGTRIDTENATVFVVAGMYRVEHDDDWTSVIARDGEAELRTPRGAVHAATDEQAWVDSAGLPVVEPAGLGDALERWAALLDGQRERLARRWLFYDYGDDEIAWEDDDFWMWDAGGPICSNDHHHNHWSEGHGDAHRTRPPGGNAVPIDSEPGRVATPIDRDGSAAGGDVAAGWTKPSRPGDVEARFAHPLPRTSGATPAPDGGWLATEIAGESAEPEPTAPAARSSADDGGILHRLGAIAARLLGGDDDAAGGSSSSDSSSSSSDTSASSSGSSSSSDEGSSSTAASSTDTSSSSEPSSSSSNDNSSAANVAVTVHETFEAPPPPEHPEHDREPNR
jgi:hypothetical protein